MICTNMLNEGKLIHTYSDSGMWLLQTDTGVVYTEAVDVYPTAHTYTETEPEYSDDEISDTEALEIITGGVAYEEE